MTDKRLFGVVKGHREHITDHTGRLYSDSEVADLLNTVHEENEQLQIEKNTLKKQHTYELTKKLEYKSKLTDLKKENKQLKSKVDDITVAVEVETCKLMDNIINLIDKKITEINQEYDPYVRQGKVLDMSNRQFAISILNELKKELKE